MPLRIRSHIAYPKKEAGQGAGLMAREPHAPRQQYGQWTPERDEMLRSIWGRVERPKLIAAIGMSQTAIYNRARLLGLALIP